MFSTLLTVTPFGMSDMLTTIGQLVTSFLGFVAQTLETVTGNPVLLFCFLVPFATVGITVVRRLINTRA
jgi:hypothetical protein